MALPETLRRMGVVGAGGAGFPTEVKAASRAEYLLANGAECEPLLHKDLEIMSHYPAEICAGMETMMRSVGAAHGKFGIKEKNKEAVSAVGPEAKKRSIDLCCWAISIPPATSTSWSTQPPAASSRPPEFHSTWAAWSATWRRCTTWIGRRAIYRSPQSS
jgi:Na+-translocating ferredoxin:NAD+ oxidoreductase RnfC subunit